MPVAPGQTTSDLHTGCLLAVRGCDGYNLRDRYRVPDSDAVPVWTVCDDHLDTVLHLDCHGVVRGGSFVLCWRVSDVERNIEREADYLNRTEQSRTGATHTHTSGYPAAVFYRERGRGEGVTLREIYIKTGHTQTPTDSRLRKTEKQTEKQTFYNKVSQSVVLMTTVTTTTTNQWKEGEEKRRETIYIKEVQRCRLL